MQRHSTMMITARLRDGDALMLAHITLSPDPLGIEDTGDTNGVFLRSVPPRYKSALGR